MEEENDMRYILDEMYDFEADFDEKEKEDEQYFIGLYLSMNVNSNHLYLGMAVSPDLFFEYEYKYVRNYLYSGIQYCRYARNYHLEISIMQLNITNDGNYLVTIKTYWLKLIQRHWKNIIQKKKGLHVKMGSWISLNRRELRGISPIQTNYPKLQGMLSAYSKKKAKCIPCHS